ncbi:hypothetical protein M758_7G121200 [Ceratodon purpureus]|uniref:Uncharacterized protein n=1 Tax=Ceratodon purpureus TaxID=3225 RepID=A0A8T0HA44_CERPU|nr:hypothetical protein KC19_7G156100 [Ceratodon purpureus]KAG0611173.1 hypothetical protein M758_7G121200 [Ceratodon purpureus]KAG0611174.1 hypothetical protein M758_7G121200 [Ceratodon purpureus]KAG0611175.1 hypothetical protein M758_7G121200 [Ceratodon purpureus]
MGSMVEAKMKPRRGNGTPHPRGRRPSVHTLHEGHNLSDEIQHSVSDQSKHVASKSALDKLLSVHTQVTQTLHQIDTLVLSIHQLASSSHLIPDEVQDFAHALASIDANLQDWSVLLEIAAERSPVSHTNLEQDPCNRGSPESTPIRGGKVTVLDSLADDLEYGAISYSPLVATDLLECESPCGNEPLICTPLHRTGGTRTNISSSPLPQTPRMLSPPRSVQVLSAISESPLLSTPARFLAFETSDGSQEPRPQDLLTPEGSTCQTHLVFETPLAQITHHGQLNDVIFPHTPKFGVSPPRTCRPLRPGETVSTESDPIPVVPSPFRTPGIFLECKGETSDSSSAGSPGIVDDLTASTVKRLGPKGLEERLWQELAIRKADILQPVKQR